MGKWRGKMKKQILVLLALVLVTKFEVEANAFAAGFVGTQIGMSRENRNRNQTMGEYDSQLNMSLGQVNETLNRVKESLLTNTPFTGRSGSTGPGYGQNEAGLIDSFPGPSVLMSP
jgi:hypothetical protein